MANLFSKSEVMLDLHMTCCLGDHRLHNPKLLPCQHSFCTECIKTKVSQGRKEMICPKCQLSIPLTEKEVDQLPDDFLYPILQKTKDNNSYCDMCKFENNNIPGTFQCLDCGEVTCDQCKSGHTRTLTTRSHRLVAVKRVQSGIKESVMEAKKTLSCQTHSDHDVPILFDRYCEDCKILVCRMCVLTQHQGHSSKTISDIHEKKTKAITDHVTKLLDIKQLDEDFVGTLEQDQGQKKLLQEQLENEVYDRAALIIDIVEKVKQDKLTEIKGHFVKEDISMKTKLEDTKNRMVRTDSIVSFTQTFLEHSDKAEFLQHEHEIMKKLKENHEQKDDRTLKSNTLVMEELKIEQMETVISEAFGKIRVETEPVKPRKDEAFVRIRVESKKCDKTPVKDVSRKWMKEPQVLFSVGSRIGDAYDLTVTENGDIVAVRDAYIQVYNSEGKPKERINCRQLQNAYNVVAKGDTLYVIDQGANGNVLVMDLTGNVKKTITLLEHNEYANNGLAVDDEGNVYITLFSSSAICRCRPNETNAKVFIQKGTHPDLQKPHYLCVTPGGELVVSNHGSSTIQVYDRNGEFLWQYKGQGDMTLSYPYGICCDLRGYIYISDCRNNRIQVVQNGDFKECIKLNDFTYPNGITLDKDDNIVCGYNGGNTITKIKVWE